MERLTSTSEGRIPPPPTRASMTTITYWCRYHGRLEQTGHDGACRTTQGIWDEREAKQKPSTDDPPCWWARVKMRLGFKVTP